MSNSKEKREIIFPMTRRAFLKISAFTGIAIAASQLFKFHKKGVEAAPYLESKGVLTETLVNTSCLNCTARCATTVRVVNGKAVRINGNPLSKVSEGEICPRGHIGLQVLYNPNRISTPLKRTNPTKGLGVEPQWKSISWNEALADVSGRLKSLRGKSESHKLVIFQGLNSTSDLDLINRFAQSYGTPNSISTDTFDRESEKFGRWMADGNYSYIAYDFGKTNYILSFGASIVESEKPLARNLRMWGKMRRERPNRAKVVVIDPRYSVTAAKADLWLPIKPGTDAALAMSIANVIISEGLYDKGFVDKWSSGFNEYKETVISSYSPEKAADMTGIAANRIREIAREFAKTKPAIAWAGKGVVDWTNGSYTSFAIFCLNALVGSIDVPGGITYQENPMYRDMPEPEEDDIAKDSIAREKLDLRKTKGFPVANEVANQTADSIISGSPYPVEIAIGFNSNFNMSAPGTGRWDNAMKKLPYYVHVAPFISEMAEYADIILPVPTFMEAWGYDHSPPGSGFAELKIKQPVIEPLYDTKNVADIIFELAGKVGGTVARSFSGIGDDARGFVRYRTENMVSWDEFRDKGVWLGPDYKYYKYEGIFNTPSRKFEFYSGTLKGALKDNRNVDSQGLTYLPHYEVIKTLGDEADYPLTLLTYQPLLTIENGSQNYAWAQEILLVMHGVGWTNFAELNTETAHELGIKDKDIIWVESPFKKIKVIARVTASIRPEVVAIASGQGHTADGEWQKSIGVNPNEIIGVDYDHLSGQSSFSNTRVKVYRA